MFSIQFFQDLFYYITGDNDIFALLCLNKYYYEMISTNDYIWKIIGINLIPNFLEKHKLEKNTKYRDTYTIIKGMDI